MLVSMLKLRLSCSARKGAHSAFPQPKATHAMSCLSSWCVFALLHGLAGMANLHSHPLLKRAALRLPSCKLRMAATREPLVTSSCGVGGQPTCAEHHLTVRCSLLLTLPVAPKRDEAVLPFSCIAEKGALRHGRWRVGSPPKLVALQPRLRLHKSWLAHVVGSAMLQVHCSPLQP